ncbi:MAG: polysaccharide pyruvyl transferase family protein [Bacteroidales bacterium]|nr:polysaccharide pyruvyl transferase family protein [Bacteroidales bacterium]
MKKFVYFANGGCGNHGCEAIVRSLEYILNSDPKRNKSLSISYAEDSRYGLTELVDTISLNTLSHRNLTYLRSYIDLKLNKSQYSLDLFPYRYVLSHLENPKEWVALSVGGDNYCYGGTDFYYELDKTFHKAGLKTAMVGCSIEPEVISKPDVKKDLASHSLIIARESITYNALVDNGLTNARLLPDPAFLLKTEFADLPTGFLPENTIGINLSPQVNKCSSDGEITSRNVDRLIEHLIAKTTMQIALIPHVIWAQSNDLDTLKPLYEKYKDTGRVILINDCNAEKLKGYIARCRFLIAARTHASIAAYSNCVPTLVIGYSVKAKGIAKDIFGTYDNYVLPSQSLKTDFDLINAFEWLKENEQSIKSHLEDFMPGYCAKAHNIKDELEHIA